MTQQVKTLTLDDLLILKQLIEKEKNNVSISKNPKSNKSSDNISLSGFYGNRDGMYRKLCELVNNNKTNEFILLLSFKDKYNYDINYSNSDNNGNILMYCVKNNNYLLVSHILKKYSDMINLDKKYSIKLYSNEKYNVFEYCNKLGYYHLGNLIRLSKLGNNLKNKIKMYQDKNEKINGISTLFNHYFKIQCSKYDIKRRNSIKNLLLIENNEEKNENNISQTYENVMALMEDTLIELINNKRPFSNDMFKIIWDYNINKLDINFDINKIKLWINLKESLVNILNINNISNDKVGWYWFKNYLLDSNIWLCKTKNNGILYDELLNIVNFQLKKQKNTLRNSMLKLINKNITSKKIWNKICQELVYNSPKFKDSASFRQDNIIKGVKSDFNVDVDNYNYDNLLSLYDYNNYITKLIITGNILNENLKNGVKYLLNDYLLNNKCFIQFGSVKSLDRCQEKCQLEYGNSKFPTSSCIIDIIRCSATFNNLSDYYNSIIHCANQIMDNKCNDITDIVRIKNGFNKEYIKWSDEKKDNNTLFVPSRYVDIKLNVIVSNGNKSLIGEIQFLIEPMLENKKENHELYEIKRINDMLVICKNNLDFIDNISNRLQIAATSKNKSELIKILLNRVNLNNHLNKKDNSTNSRTLLMQCIVSTNDLSLFNIILQNINSQNNNNNTNFLLLDNDKNNILHYIIKHTKSANKNNIKIFSKFIELLIDYSKNNNYNIINKLLNEKDKKQKTPFFYDTNYDYLKCFAKVVYYNNENILIDLLYNYITQLSDLTIDSNNFITFFSDNRLTKSHFNSGGGAKITMKSLENNCDLSLFDIFVKMMKNSISDYSWLYKNVDNNNNNCLHYILKYSDNNNSNNVNIFKNLIKSLLKDKNKIETINKIINTVNSDKLKPFMYELKYKNNVLNYLKIFSNELRGEDILTDHIFELANFNNNLNKSYVNNCIKLLHNSVLVNKNLLSFNVILQNTNEKTNFLYCDENNNENILHYIIKYTNSNDTNNLNIFTSFIKLLLKYNKSNKYKMINSLITQQNKDSILTPFEIELINSKSTQIPKYSQIFISLACNYNNDINKKILFNSLNNYMKPNKVIIDQNKSYVSQNGTTIKIIYKSIKEEYLCNNIISYHIQYKIDNNKSSKWQIKTYTSDNNNNSCFILDNLLINETYIIKILGKTIFGFGNCSDEFRIKTEKYNKLNLSVYSYTGCYNDNFKPSNLLLTGISNSYCSSPDNKINHSIIFKCKNIFTKLTMIKIRNGWDLNAIKSFDIFVSLDIKSNKWIKYNLQKIFHRTREQLQSSIVNIDQNSKINDNKKQFKFIKITFTKNHGKNDGFRISMYEFQAYGVLKS